MAEIEKIIVPDPTSREDRYNARIIQLLEQILEKQGTGGGGSTQSEQKLIVYGAPVLDGVNAANNVITGTVSQSEQVESNDNSK